MEEYYDDDNETKTGDDEKRNDENENITNKRENISSSGSGVFTEKDIKENLLGPITCHPRPIFCPSYRGP